METALGHRKPSREEACRDISRAELLSRRRSYAAKLLPGTKSAPIKKSSCTSSNFAYTLFSNAVRTPFIFALSLVFAGGASNLIDRFVHDGYVVDFINLGVGPLRTGIFNVADIAISIGVFMLFVPRWRKQAMWTNSAVEQTLRDKAAHRPSL